MLKNVLSLFTGITGKGVFHAGFGLKITKSVVLHQLQAWQ
jgi:hypothetical protein